MSASDTAAAAKTGGLSYETKMVWTLAVTFGFVFFDRNAVSWLAPFIAPDLNLSYTQVGMLSSGLSLTWAISALVVGGISDATGVRKLILMISIVLFALCSFLSGIATSFILLLASRILMGASEGGIMPISQALVVLASDEKRRGFNMGIMQNFGSAALGQFVAPLVLVWVATHWGWREAFFVAGVPALICALLVAKIIREPKKEEIAAHDADVQKIEGVKRASGVALVLGNKNLLLSLLISVCMVSWMILGWTFYPQFYTDVRKYDPSALGPMLAIFGVSSMAGALFVTGLSDKIGRKPVMVWFTLLGALCPIAAIYFGGPMWALGALIFVGWLASGTFPIFMATIPAETLPASVVATVIGLVVGVGEIVGGVLSPLLGGMAADAYGLQAPLLVQIVLCVMAAILSLFLTETAPVKVKAKAAA